MLILTKIRYFLDRFFGQGMYDCSSLFLKELMLLSDNLRVLWAVHVIDVKPILNLFSDTVWPNFFATLWLFQIFPQVFKITIFIQICTIKVLFDFIIMQLIACVWCE